MGEFKAMIFGHDFSNMRFHESSMLLHLQVKL